MPDVQVIVVGAGPAGLAAAITLGHQGVPTLLVERRTEPPTLPRATVVGTRSMELIRSWGLEQEVLAGGVDAEVLLWESPTLAEVGAGRGYTVGYPTRAQASVVSPTAPATVPQDWVEAVLRRHVRTLPSVHFAVGTEVVAVAQGPAGVEVVQRDVAGTARVVRSSYLIAADGAHAGIRSMVGIGTDLRAGALGGVQVVIRAPLWPLLGDHRYTLYSVTTPESPGLFLPAGVDNRFIYASGLEDDDDRAPGVDPARLAAAIRLGAGVDDLEVDIERIGPFLSQAEIADRFRSDRVFLAGDAAHRVTPRGGTGMNIAIQGGHDLGWKMAWVLRGWAGSALLDTYEAERRAVAEHDLDRSTDPNGSRRPVVDELNVDLGGRLVHTWVATAPSGVSTLDLLGQGWTLFTGPAGGGPADPTRSAAPFTVTPVDALTAARLGIGRRGALLARPDGVPVALWTEPVTAADLDHVAERFASGRADLAVA